MDFLQKIWVLFLKDVRREMRRWETIAAMLTFSLLVVVIMTFALDSAQETVRATFPGALWISLFFAGTLGVSESMKGESVDGRMIGLMLTPVDRSSIYYAKLLSNIVFMAVVEVVAVPLFFAFAGLSVSFPIGSFVLILFLGTFGFVAMGTFLAGVAAGARLGEYLLPLLLFPILVPVLMGAVQSTGAILWGDGLASVASWVRILSVFDVIFLVIPLLLFEYLLEV